MITVSIYILCAVYIVVLLRQLYVYATKRPPTGPDSMTWSLGQLFTLAAIALFSTALLLICFDYPKAALFLLGLPLVLMMLGPLSVFFRTIYARSPSFKKIPQLTLSVKNVTGKKVYLKFDCHFTSLYASIEYLLEPFEEREVKLSRYETRLLATKSQQILIYSYEIVKEQRKMADGFEFTGLFQLHPCIQYNNEKPTAFRSGLYQLVIDDSRKEPPVTQTKFLFEFPTKGRRK